MKEAVHPAGGSKWAWTVGYSLSLKSEKCLDEKESGLCLLANEHLVIQFNTCFEFGAGHLVATVKTGRVLDKKLRLYL